MPLSPLTLIAATESSFGTNVSPNGTSTASGIYQFVNATWQQNLLAIGGDPSVYPTAGSAPAAVQTAVAAHDFNVNGFADWTCANCNPTLVQALADAGGPSSYLAQGSLSESPADYASLNTPAGLQAYFNTNSGGSFVGAATMQQTAAGTQALAAVNASPTAKPFSYAYSLVVNTASQSIAQNIATAQQLAQPWLFWAVVFAVAIVGIGFMAARRRIDSLIEMGIRFTIVSLFAVVGSVFYSTYVQATVTAIPDAIGAAFGLSGAGPMAVFDDSASTLYVILETILQNMPVTFAGFGAVILSVIIYIAGYIFLLVLALPYISTVFLLLLMLIIVPLTLPAALFRTFDRWVVGAADQIMTLAVQLFAIAVVVSIYQMIIVQMMSGFASTGTPDADIPAFAGLVGVLFVMAFTVWKYLVNMISRVFGGVGIHLGEAGGSLLRVATR